MLVVLFPNNDLWYRLNMNYLQSHSLVLGAQTRRHRDSTATYQSYRLVMRGIRELARLPAERNESTAVHAACNHIGRTQPANRSSVMHVRPAKSSPTRRAKFLCRLIESEGGGGSSDGSRFREQCFSKWSGRRGPLGRGLQFNHTVIYNAFEHGHCWMTVCSGVKGAGS